MDKFLKVSRILRRRSVANSACGGERVFVNGKAVKPAYTVKIGDEVRIEFGTRALCFTVKSLDEKVTKEGASALYELKDEDNQPAKDV